MAEVVREIRIELYVETNKRSISRTFGSVAALRDFLRDLGIEDDEPADAQP